MARVKPQGLKELKEQLEAYWSKTRAMQNSAKEWYYQAKKVDIDLPEGITTHRSATATLMIDEIREQFRMDEPIVTAKARGTNPKDFKKKGMQEMWGKSILRQLADDSYMNPLLQPPFDLPMLGQSAVKWLPKPWVLDKDKPKRRDGESKKDYDERIHDWEYMRDTDGMFELRALDPMTVYPEPGTRKPRYVLEVQSRRLVDIVQGDYDHNFDVAKFERQFLKKNEKASPLTAVDWVEYWSWLYDPDENDWYGHYMVEAGGQLVIDRPNILKHVPYSVRFSGLGRRDASNDPSTMAVNVLQTIEGELESQMKVMTAMSAQWLFHVFPRLLAPDDKTAGQWARMYMKGPAGIITFDAESTNLPQWMDAPAPNNDMLQFLQKIEDNISRRARAGFRGETQANYGVQEALLIGQQLKLLSPVKEQIDLMGADILEGIARIMDVYDLKMNVSGVGAEGENRMITGADLRHTQFEVSFEAVDPAENDRRMLTMGSLWEKGAISLRTFMDTALKGVVPNAEEEEIQIMAEDVEALMLQQLLPGLLIQMIQSKAGQQQAEEVAGQAQAGAQAVMGGMGDDVLGSAERALSGLTGELGTSGGTDSESNVFNQAQAF